MALAYPEGEVFFERKSLVNSWFSAEKPEQFYSHIIVEYIWNQPAASGKDVKVKYNLPEHPRSTFHYGQAANALGYGDYYNWWDQLPFSYGPWDGIQRRYQHNLCGDPFRFDKRINSDGAAEAYFMMLPMPKKEERWVWIDLLSFLRAIYIPICQQTNEQYQNLCTYYQINFTRKSDGLKIWHMTHDQFDDVPCDKTFGIPTNHKKSIGFDIYGLCQLLSLPRQLRKGNAYNLKMITLLERGSMKPVIPLSKDRGQFVDSNDFSWTQLAQSSYGLELVWKPFIPNNPWFVNNIRNGLQFGLGFIPEVGFVLQIAFALGWAAIFDPDNFIEAIESNVPGFAQFGELYHAIKGDAEEIKQLMPPGWNQAANPLQIPHTLVKDAVDTTDKNPAPEIEPVGEAASFKKGDKVLKESANKSPPLVEVNI